MRILQVHLSLVIMCLFCTSAFAGYTQYYTWHQKPGDTELKTCISEMRRVIEARTNILAGPDGTGTVIIDPSHLALNGIGEESHETFIFPGELGFNFCKTAAKPYDEVVTACLLVARDHFPSSVLSIDSDGSWSEGDWQDGIKLYTSVLGRTPQNPMSPLWQVVGWRYSLYAYGSFALLLVIGVLILRTVRKKWRGF